MAPAAHSLGENLHYVNRLTNAVPRTDFVVCGRQGQQVKRRSDVCKLLLLLQPLQP